MNTEPTFCPHPDRSERRGRQRRLVPAALFAVGSLVLVVSLVASLLGPATADDGPAAGAPREAQAAPPSAAVDDGLAVPTPGLPATPDQLDVEVDATLVPVTPTVPSLDETGEPRSVGRIRSTGGTESDVVLGELIVAVHDDAELTAFCARWSCTVLDSDEPDPVDGVTEHLVRVDPGRGDVAGLAADLVSFEPHHVGTLATSHPELLSLLAIAAHETATHGTEVSLNWLEVSTGIAEGTAHESPALLEPDQANPDREGPDPFGWSYMASNTPQDIGVDVAWQLLAGRLGYGNRVKIMVVDGGFYPNADFPVPSNIRKGQWHRDNPWQCGSGASCPTHGTGVVIAAMGQVDNGFGAAGPAGPIAELVAVELAGTTWKTLRRVEQMVEEERPDIINMSFGTEVTVFQGSAERIQNRRFRRIEAMGALSFTSAGNSGIDVDSNDALTLPCEVPNVVCVGGMGIDTTARHPGSNYGTNSGNRSVEIYGPYCVLAPADPRTPGDDSMGWVCGTSLASPFVAGVAALVKSGWSTATPDQVWAIVRDTAHVGGLGAEVTGSQRRVDAAAAMAAVLQMSPADPTVSITAPAQGTEISPLDFLDLEGEARAWTGVPLGIVWRSSLDGELNSTPRTGTVVTGELSPGVHVITATATDIEGRTSTASVQLTVTNTPPNVGITSPGHGTVRYDTEPIHLSAVTADADELWQPLSDVRVGWRIVRAGTDDVVWQATGHTSTVHPGQLSPGDYEVRFFGQDLGNAIVWDAVGIRVEAVPAGESVPSVTMLSPRPGGSYSVGHGGDVVDLELRASAQDPEDGALSGTRMRWLAVQGTHTVVLCTGSSFPGAGGAGLQPGSGGGGGVLSGGVKDCSDVTAQLGMAPDAPANPVWTLVVEAADSAGLVGRAELDVDIPVSVA